MKRKRDMPKLENKEEEEEEETRAELDPRRQFANATLSFSTTNTNQFKKHLLAASKMGDMSSVFFDQDKMRIIYFVSECLTQITINLPQLGIYKCITPCQFYISINKFVRATECKKGDLITAHCNKGENELVVNGYLGSDNRLRKRTLECGDYSFDEIPLEGIPFTPVFSAKVAPDTFREAVHRNSKEIEKTSYLYIHFTRNNLNVYVTPKDVDTLAQDQVESFVPDLQEVVSRFEYCKVYSVLSALLVHKKASIVVSANEDGYLRLTQKYKSFDISTHMAPKVDED